MSEQIEPPKHFYIAKLCDIHTYDVITGITEDDVNYLYKILNQHIERQNGDWDSNTESCLELLEYVKLQFNDEKKCEPFPKVNYPSKNLLTNEGRDYIHKIE
jgi:hypothetical protein